MLEIGDVTRFGFRIGPPAFEAEVREVAIFINGENVTDRDSSAYLPSYVAGLRRQSDVLKGRMNFEKYAQMFRAYNLSEVHNILVHGDSSLFLNDRERADIADFHRFMDLGEPNSDLFTAFLLPANGGLSLTYQRLSVKENFARVDVVSGVDHLLPYELITTIDEAILHLST